MVARATIPVLARHYVYAVVDTAVDVFAEPVPPLMICNTRKQARAWLDEYCTVKPCTDTLRIKRGRLTLYGR